MDTTTTEVIHGTVEMVRPQGAANWTGMELIPFETIAERFLDLELTQATRDAIATGTPFLGICVGLQWLYDGSTEAEATEGLSHFGGSCEHFPAIFDDVPLKSPHVGWNSLDSIRPDSRLLRGIAPGAFVYYTHSWRAPVSSDTAAVTNYGGPFTAVVERDNVMGVQFHPEKSADTGLQILRNFLELA